MKLEIEKITAAACGFAGRIYSMPAPASHKDILCAMMQVGAYPVMAEDEGFLTSAGRFVNRREAARIAKLAGQIVAPIEGPGDILTTANVW